MTVQLEQLLAPHVDLRLPALDGQGRFVDASAETVRSALAVLDTSLATSRPNLQPPAAWLVECAEELGGLLGGSYMTSPWESLRVDAICVPRTTAAELARRVDAEWPAIDGWPPALELALAEGWTSWVAQASVWEGPGAALLGDLPDLPVFGLWWD